MLRSVVWKLITNPRGGTSQKSEYLMYTVASTRITQNDVLPTFVFVM
jgi:hypothetical protein